MFQNKSNLETIDSKKTTSEAIGWLLELELTQDPNFNNVFILNLFKISKHIKDVQLINDSVSKKMLIYFELDWWGKVFNRYNIEQQVDSLMKEALPTYKHRLVFDRKLFEKALSLVKGEYNE